MAEITESILDESKSPQYNDLQKDKWNISPSNQLNIERRSTRIKYRQLAEDTIQNRANIIGAMDQRFVNNLVTQNDLYDNGI